MNYKSPSRSIVRFEGCESPVTKGTKAHVNNYTRLSEEKFKHYLVELWLQNNGFTFKREYPFCDLDKPYLGSSFLDYLAVDPAQQEWLVEVKAEFSTGVKPRNSQQVSRACEKACAQIVRYKRLFIRDFPYKADRVRSMLIVPANGLTSAEIQRMETSADRLVTIEIPYTYPFIHVAAVNVWLKADPVYGWRQVPFVKLPIDEYLPWYENRLGSLSADVSVHYAWLMERTR